MILTNRVVPVCSMLLAVVLNFSWVEFSDAAILSSTVNQSGDRFINSPLGTGVGAKVGTFSYSHGFSNFQSFRFRGWVDLAGDFILPSSPRLIIAPFGTSVLDIALNNPSVVTTTFSIENVPVGSSNTVDERQSLWVPLGSAGSTVASYINGDALGRIDIWFFSNTESDLWFPASTLTNQGVDADFNPILVDVPYTATFEIDAAPEPSTLLGFLVFFLTLLICRRHLRTQRSCAT